MSLTPSMALPRTSSVGSSWRLLRQIADPGALGDETLADEFGVDAGHDAQQRRLARAVDAEHADLGVGVEGEVDVLQHLLAARPGLGEALHVIDELARGHRNSWIVRRLARAYQGRAGEARRANGLSIELDVIARSVATKRSSSRWAPHDFWIARGGLRPSRDDEVQAKCSVLYTAAILAITTSAAVRAAPPRPLSSCCSRVLRASVETS